jgi:hypothetical protein
VLTPVFCIIALVGVLAALYYLAAAEFRDATVPAGPGQSGH